MASSWSSSSLSSWSPRSSTFSVSSSSFSSLPPKFKLPAKPRHSAFHVSAPSLTSLSRSPASDRILVSGRRGLMSTATLPLLLQLREFIEGSFPETAA
ncbi:hypothetical protein CRG98_014600, partial [Punica granatum]